MRVAFTLVGGSQWTGGRNYLLNLFTVLERHQSQAVTPILFVGADCNVEETLPFSAISGVVVVRTPLMNPSRRAAELARSLIFGCDSRVRRLFRHWQIDVVFEPARFFGWRLGIPAIAWIPDFFHQELPQLFSRRVWWKREIGIRTQILGGRTIMLSSETARLECERHYPSTRRRTCRVRFAVPVGAEIPTQEARAVADAYDLPENFFFLPNQFWRHKNHDLVLEALRILRERGACVVVAASGNQHDPHAPGHFLNFKQRLEFANLTGSFRLLGMVPYPHLARLMRASVALLNPSLSEGWSTTVEEARATGTPLILSDLAVHREHMGERAVYFDRHSATSLADALEHFVPLTRSERDQRIADARKEVDERVEQFARDFVSVCEVARGGPSDRLRKE